jgi:hypothetical protein
LEELSSGRRLPYLFWEGHAYILPTETQGFVVNSADVESFLERELPQLGLNEKETRDFISAWSSRFTGSPYYFITFLEKAVIDRYYPLRIDPPPDTTIRVLMDFAPLSRPIVVQPLSLVPSPTPTLHGGGMGSTRAIRPPEGTPRWRSSHGSSLGLQRKR